MKKEIKKIYDKCIKAQLDFEFWGGKLASIAQPHTGRDLHFQEVHGDGLCFGFDGKDRDIDGIGYLVPIGIFFKLAEEYGEIPDDVLEANCI